MRTYSIRRLCCEGTATRLVVDVVLHPGLGPFGPGAAWASSAVVGSEVLVVGPRRGNLSGGIELAPAGAMSVTLAGDESAAPAIARILEDIDRAAVGTAFIEVPSAADALPIDAPDGVDVRWLPRGGRAHGTALLPVVLQHVGLTPAPATAVDPGRDPLWETPTYSGLGEPLPDAVAPADRYYWIAGEAGVVTTLRRHLVRDASIDRPQVAFMGYWRLGTTVGA